MMEIYVNVHNCRIILHLTFLNVDKNSKLSHIQLNAKYTEKADAFYAIGNSCSHA